MLRSFLLFNEIVVFFLIPSIALALLLGGGYNMIFDIPNDQGVKIQFSLLPIILGILDLFYRHSKFKFEGFKCFIFPLMGGHIFFIPLWLAMMILEFFLN